MLWNVEVKVQRAKIKLNDYMLRYIKNKPSMVCKTNKRFNSNLSERVAILNIFIISDIRFIITNRYKGWYDRLLINNLVPLYAFVYNYTSSVANIRHTAAYFRYLMYKKTNKNHFCSNFLSNARFSLAVNSMELNSHWLCISFS